jgi:polyisoprenoid-binding protein YceI
MRHNSFRKHVLRPVLVVGALGATAAAPLLAAVPASAATAKAGAKCTTAGVKSGTLVCTKKSGKLVWVKAAPPTTTAAAATTAATTAAAASATAAGIDGTWKPTPASLVGYRAKEVLNGQSTEGVGRTNAVTGSVTIAGTKATAAALTIDVTTLKSDQGNRDRQVQGRILDTATHPTATLKLKSPVDFGKVPADKEAISAKAAVELTLRGVNKTVDVALNARRNGANIEVQGTIPITWADFSIPDPSNGPAQVEPKGVIEFLVVLAK